MYIFLLTIAVLILFLWQLSNLLSIIFGSVYVKTPKDVIVFALKKADLKKSDLFYDLGCGNGESLIVASKMAKRCIGIEISPYYYLLSRWRSLNYRNVEIKYGNINKVDLSGADVVYAYLLPAFLKKLSKKFVREKPKKIISIGFPIPNLANEQVFKYKNYHIYIYSLRSR